MRRLIKKVIAAGLTAAIICSGLTMPANADAAKKATVKKVTINKKKVTLYAKAAGTYGSVKLRATVKPKKAAKTKIKWKSSNKKVASVNAKGLVKARKPGKATIIARAGKKQAKCKVIVKKIKIKVKKVTVTPKNITLQKGKTSTIKSSVSPKKATLKKVIYKSSNSKVAAVSGNGKVIAVSAGTARITVTAADGSKKKATVNVRVINPPTPVKPTAKPSIKPTATPTTEPTIKPTATPTTEPTIKPTATPTTEPTIKPTATPTTEPTIKPTATPTIKPTATPTTEPTATPGRFETEISGVVNGANTEYSLDMDTEYLIQGVYNEKEDSVVVNDSTVTLVRKVMQRLSNATNLEMAYDKFVNYAITETTYEAAENIAVKVSKAAGANVANVTVIRADKNTTTNCTVTFTRNADVYRIKAEKDSLNYVEANITATGENSYEVSGIKIMKNGVAYQEDRLRGEVISVIADTQDEITTVKVTSAGKRYEAVMTYNRLTNAVTVTVTGAVNKAIFTYDGNKIVQISVPTEYLKKYQIKLFR